MANSGPNWSKLVSVPQIAILTLPVARYYALRTSTTGVRHKWDVSTNADQAVKMAMLIRPSNDSTNYRILR